jgi:hypothetical protein
MADLYFKGGASTTAQEDRFTPAGTIEVGDIFNIVLSGEDGSTATISAVATGTTVAQVCADLLTAWTASTSTLKTGITASNQTTYFKLLGTAGTPFHAVATTTETGGGAADAQTFSRTATTANSGPKDWATAANWSTGSIPATGDDVTIDGRAANSIIYSLDQNAVVLASLLIAAAMIYDVGTTAGALKIGATLQEHGRLPDDGSTPGGSGLVNIDCGSNGFTAEVFSTKNIGTSGLAPLMLVGSGTNNLYISGGTVGFATAKPGQTGTLTLGVVGPAGKLTTGSGATVTTATNNGGRLYVNGAVTTLNHNSGKTYTDGTGAITTLNQTLGTVYLNNRASGDSIVTLNLDGGTLDASGDPQDVSLTTTNWNGGTIKRAASQAIDLGTATVAFGDFTSLQISGT